MLKNVKSLAIQRRIFSHLDKKCLLEIVKYNKNFQKNLNIKIRDFQLLSRSYIIYEKSGYGKEYDWETDLLIYEGNFLNGRRNGKGTEYDVYGEVIYEGEYLNGKRVEKDLINKLEIENGVKKVYNYLNELVFERESSDGKKIKKEYDEKGNIKFEGEYLDGKRNGKCKVYYSNGALKFEGEYLNGKKWNGIVYDKNNNFLYELKDGTGHVIKKTFVGEYLNGEKNGKGKEYLKSDSDWLLHDRLIFEGEFLKGKRNGKGKEFSYGDGTLLFEGEYSKGYRLKGKEYFRGKLLFEGEYLFNKKWNGKVHDIYDNHIYDLIDGNGKVIEYDHNTGLLLFEGEYLNGRRWSGEGKTYYNGELIFEGKYLNGY